MTKPIKTKQQIINEKVKEFEKQFSREVIYQPKDIDDIQAFLSQSLNSAIDETIEAIKIGELFTTISTNPLEIQKTDETIEGFEMAKNLQQELINFFEGEEELEEMMLQAGKNAQKRQNDLIKKAKGGK